MPIGVDRFAGAKVVELLQAAAVNARRLQNLLRCSRSDMNAFIAQVYLRSADGLWIILGDINDGQAMIKKRCYHDHVVVKPVIFGQFSISRSHRPLADSVHAREKALSLPQTAIRH